MLPWQVFGLQRFRETELIHGRWAMLATLGVVVAEATTGVAWQDAGKVELDGASYLGLSLPFTVTCAPRSPRTDTITQPQAYMSGAVTDEGCCFPGLHCLLAGLCPMCIMDIGSYRSVEQAEATAVWAGVACTVSPVQGSYDLMPLPLLGLADLKRVADPKRVAA